MDISIFNKLNIKNIYIYLLVVVMILYVAISYKEVNLQKREIYSLNNDWTVENDDSSYSTLNLPCKIPNSINKKIKIFKKLPKSISDIDNIYIYTVEQGLEVSVNSKVVYSQNMTYKKSSLLSMLGHGWNRIHIPENSENCILSITYKSYNNDKNVDIYQIYGASGSQFSDIIIKEYGVVFVLSLSVLIIGTISMGLFFILKGKTNEAEVVRYFAEIMIVSSIWLITQNHVLKFFVERFDIVSLIGNMFFILFPLTLAVYLLFVDEFKNSKVLMSVVLFLKLYIISRYILGFVGILPISSCYTFTSVVTYATLIVIGIVIFKNMYFNYSKHILTIEISFIVLFIFFILDRHFTQIDIIAYNGIYSAIGLIIFFFLQSYVLSIQMKKMLHKIQFIDRYRSMAVTDSLTSLSNRFAFDSKLAEINQIIKKNPAEFSNKVFCIVMIDLNNLKPINDNYGHSMGDDAIIRCADSIKQCFEGSGVNFGGEGYAYRIGGDEFSAIIFGMSEDTLKKKIELFHESLSRQSSVLEYNLEAALGYSYFDSKTDKSSSEVNNRADENMYKLKKKMKKASDFSRR